MNQIIEQPKIYKIDRVINEADSFKTLVIKGKINTMPGQFVMFWIPGVEMKPFSISYEDENEFHITVMKVGDFTKRMFELKKGDKVGIQGPYGKGFDLSLGKKVVIVGGGCGIAPVSFLMHKAKKIGKEIHFIGGCRNKDLFIKKEEIEKTVSDFSFVTDDGTLGEKGFTTDALEKLLIKEKFDVIYACGPEIMLYKIAQIADKAGVKCEISVERMMKCAIGICGQCCIDESGKRACADGPVFDSKFLLNSKEFGKYHRDVRGRMVEF